MLSRRDFLTASGGLIVGLASIKDTLSYAQTNNLALHSGWIPDKVLTTQFKRQHRVSMFSQAGRNLAGTGEGKKALLWKFLEQVNGPFVPHDQAIGDCFVSGTLVQTPNGVVPIERLDVGDKVYTGRGTISNIISTRKIENRQTITIKIIGGENIQCTPDHQFLVYRSKRVNGRRVTNHLRNKSINSTSTAVKCKNSTPIWVEARNLTENDYILTPVEIEKEGTCSLEPDWLFLLGHFIGDGHASGGSIEHTFGIDEDELVQRIRSTYEKYGYKPKFQVYKNKKACRLRVHSRKLVRSFVNEFYRHKEKVFPNRLIGSWAVLQGLKAADGFDRSKNHYIDNSSTSVIYGAYLSLVKLGAEPTINRPRANQKGRFKNAKPCYRLCWIDGKLKHYTWKNERFYCRPIISITPNNILQDVYDIGVEDESHSFLANGSIVHNCVSQAWGLSVDILDAIQISRGKGEWIAKAATEVIYAGGRVEVGDGRIRGDGMHGSLAGNWCKDYGILLRKPYLDGKYDFSEYSGSKARKWAHKCRTCTPWGGGVPDELEPLAKEHPVKTITLVTSWEQARDALYNGYPIAVCSSYGFDSDRDSQGFAEHNTIWYHSMALAGMDDTNKRPGGLFINSWGDWIKGPTRLDQPSGSFWVDAGVIDEMLKQEDSFALSNYIGYPRQKLDYDIF